MGLSEVVVVRLADLVAPGQGRGASLTTRFFFGRRGASQLSYAQSKECDHEDHDVDRQTDQHSHHDNFP